MTAAIRGYWQVEGRDLLPSDLDGINEVLAAALERGDEIVVREGITLRWSPVLPVSAAALYAALSDAKAACPPDCSLVVESGRLLCAAMYRRTNEYGTHNAWYATGATEAEALSKLAAKIRGQAVAA